MQDPIRLQLRFLLAALLPMLAVLATAWGIATWTYTRALEQRVSEQLQNAAAVLQQGRLPLSPELLQRIAELQGADIALLDTAGRVVGDTTGPLASAAAAGLAGLTIGERANVARRMQIEGQPAIVVAETLRGARDPRFDRILLVASLRDAREAARRAAFGMGAAFLVAGALLAALMLYLVRGITTPIERVVAMAKQIAAGRRDVHLPPERAGDVAAVARALNDLSARLQAFEDELAARSRTTALGEMSARIAHEIRNPLTALKLHLQLLEERVDAAQRPTVVRLLDELRRLELIVASALADAQVRKRAAGGPRQDLREPVGEVLDLMEPSLQHRGVALERVLEEVPALSIDRDRIKQALLNLLSNAADAMPHGGRIRVSVARDADAGQLALHVEDSGPGIPPPQRPSVLAGGSSGKPFGLGLGLKVCQEVVGESGGRLAIGDSAALGGARISLYWPLPDPAAVPHA